jgi:ankyrin repeat protein
MNNIHDEGETALHEACRDDDTECVKELLVHGADTTVKDKNGKTPLDLAKENKHLTVINLFIEHEKRSDSVLSELSTIKAQASYTEERLLLKVEAIINSLREELHQDMIDNKDDMKETAKKSSSDLESKVETIVNHRNEELCNKNSSCQDKMNQSLDNLTIPCNAVYRCYLRYVCVGR